MVAQLNAIVTHRIEVASGLIILRVAPDEFGPLHEYAGLLSHLPFFPEVRRIHAEKYW